MFELVAPPFVAASPLKISVESVSKGRFREMLMRNDTEDELEGMNSGNDGGEDWETSAEKGHSWSSILKGRNGGKNGRNKAIARVRRHRSGEIGGNADKRKLHGEAESNDSPITHNRSSSEPMIFGFGRNTGQTLSDGDRHSTEESGGDPAIEFDRFHKSADLKWIDSTLSGPMVS